MELAIFSIFFCRPGQRYCAFCALAYGKNPIFWGIERWGHQNGSGDGAQAATTYIVVGMASMLAANCSVSI